MWSYFNNDECWKGLDRRYFPVKELMATMCYASLLVSELKESWICSAFVDVRPWHTLRPVISRRADNVSEQNAKSCPSSSQGIPSATDSHDGWPWRCGSWCDFECCLMHGFRSRARRLRATVTLAMGTALWPAVKIAHRRSVS